MQIGKYIPNRRIGRELEAMGAVAAWRWQSRSESPLKERNNESGLFIKTIKLIRSSRKELILLRLGLQPQLQNF